MQLTGHTAMQGASVQCMHEIEIDFSPGWPSPIVTTRRRSMPQNLVLVLAGRRAGVALDAPLRVTQEFHAGHVACSSLEDHARSRRQSVVLVSCM